MHVSFPRDKGILGEGCRYFEPIGFHQEGRAVITLIYSEGMKCPMVMVRDDLRESKAQSVCV